MASLGTYVDGTYDTYSVPNTTETTIRHMSLSKGTWLVMTNGNWSGAFSQSSNVMIKRNTANAAIRRTTGASGGDFFLAAIVKLDNTTTIKANLYQASGATQDIPWLTMQAVRIG